MRNTTAEFDSCLKHLTYRHDLWRAFGDFCEMGALAMSNAVPKDPAREEQYERVRARYNEDEFKLLTQMMVWTVEGLEEKPHDFLGAAFMRHELGNHYAGQYFTPYPVCEMMAKVLTGSTREAILGDKPFVRAAEPCVGSGAMVIALAEAFKEAGLDPVRYLHVTAVDVAAVCVHMAVIQLSLLAIPALVFRGNSLSLETSETFATPTHWMGGWTFRLQTRPAGAESGFPASDAYSLTDTPENRSDGARAIQGGTGEKKGQLKLW